MQSRVFTRLDLCDAAAIFPGVEPKMKKTAGKVCPREMLPKLTPNENQLGVAVDANIPDVVTGVLAFDRPHAQIWERAKRFLQVRNNDAHTIYAYGLAKALCEAHPEADSEVVLPAILLHDTGWSQVPEDEVLQAIAPGAGRPDLVLQHEKEGVRIATAILTELGYERTRLEQITDIIYTHDSVKEALSLNDALVKDADKLWRITPHGIDTVMDWFGLDRQAATRLVSLRVHDYLHTDFAKTMARGFGAVASVDCFPERVELG